jgi:Inorganic Pyrophosphatase
MPEPIKINNIKFNIEFQTQKEGEDFLIVQGTASTNSKDSDGDVCIISPVAIREYIKANKEIKMDVDHAYFQDTYTEKFFTPSMRNFVEGQDKWQNIKYKDRIIGEVIELEYNPKDISFDSLDLENMPKIVMTCKCKITDKEAIEDIKAGNLTGFSLFWSGQVFKAGKNYCLYTQLDDVMLTITSSPKNNDCNDLVVAQDQEHTENTRLKLKGKPQKVIECQEVDIIGGYELMTNIEYKKGQTRHGKELTCDYGFISDFIGEDGSGLDCYLSTDLTGGKIFKVFQVNKDTLKFDESKIMLGFSTIQEAKQAYVECVNSEMYNGIIEITFDELLKYKKQETKSKPFDVQVQILKANTQILVNGIQIKIN